ncbi:MAG: hypothetical protein ACI4E1_12085 [Lachnospira sp.]
MKLASFSNINRILFLIPAIPTATTYADDIASKYQYFQIVRGKVNKYILGKILICFISTFFISFISLNLYSLRLTYIYGAGIIGSGNYNVYNAFYDYMSSNMPYLTIIAMVFLFSLVSGVYAVMGLTLTAFVRSRFAAYFSTIFISIVMETFFRYLPASISLFKIQAGNEAYHTDTSLMIILSASVSMGYILISGLIFARRVKRRIRHEIS